MTASPDTLFARLDALGIAHATHWHAPVFTVDEGRDLKASMPGGHTKIRLNQLHRHIGTKRLSFGSPEDLLARLGVTPGSVTAFALINDTAGQVRFIVDAALLACDPVNFHPLTNTATTAISRADFRRFVEATGHDFESVDFSQLLQAE